MGLFDRFKKNKIEEIEQKSEPDIFDIDDSFVKRPKGDLRELEEKKKELETKKQEIHEEYIRNSNNIIKDANREINRMNEEINQSINDTLRLNSELKTRIAATNDLPGARRADSIAVKTFNKLREEAYKDERETEFKEKYGSIGSAITRHKLGLHYMGPDGKNINIAKNYMKLVEAGVITNDTFQTAYLLEKEAYGIADQSELKEIEKLKTTGNIYDSYNMSIIAYQALGFCNIEDETIFEKTYSEYCTNTRDDFYLVGEHFKKKYGFDTDEGKKTL